MRRIIVGGWWSAWHLLPNVWSGGAASGELAVSIFLMATASASSSDT